MKDLQQLRKRLDQQNQIEAILDEYIELGAGIRHSDAQEYVNDLRAEDGVLEGEKQEA
ncbi:MAG: hypothetical protein KF852_13355 [Saprospiraceae bacterium]|nr:hypothetical protein [Saprospiraceae bacterium]